MIDHLNLILDRLQLNHAEITYSASLSPIRHVYRLLPVGAVAWGRWPFVYVEPGQETYSWVNESYLDVTGALTIVFVYGPSENDTPDTDGESQQTNALLTIRQAFRLYYFTHPRLHTASLGNLAGLQPGRPVLLGSSRPVTLTPETNEMKAPRSPQLRGLEFPLTYAARVNIK